MSTVTRTAGVAGTFTYTLSQVPVSAPVVTIYGDSARTIVVVPAAAMVATPNPAAFTAAYPASLPAGTYSLGSVTVFTAGQPGLADNDDTLVLTAPTGTVNGNLVTLDQVKTYLQVQTGNDDTFLQTLLDAALPVINSLAGPTLATTRVERHDGEDDTICLQRYPLQQIVSVTELRGSGNRVTLQESTPANAIDGYQLDPDTGTLWRVATGGYPQSWWPGQRNIEITYVPGRATVPANIPLALLELIAHWWRYRRGGTQTFATPDQPAGAPGASWGIPYRVKAILGSSLRAPSIG